MFSKSTFRLTILASVFALAAAAPAAFAQGPGTWYNGIHTDAPTGAIDDGARHSKEVMEKNVAPISVTTNTGNWYKEVHTDPSTGAIDDGARHSKEVMNKRIATGSSTSAASQKFWVPAY